MQELMYDSLQWSEHFWKQMQLEIYINSERMFLKDVVYTEVYDQRKIDDWSESMHKTVTELAHREIKKDKRLVDWAVDHIVESDKTYNLFKAEIKREGNAIFRLAGIPIPYIFAQMSRLNPRLFRLIATGKGFTRSKIT